MHFWDFQLLRSESSFSMFFLKRVQFSFKVNGVFGHHSKLPGKHTSRYQQTLNPKTQIWWPKYFRTLHSYTSRKPILKHTSRWSWSLFVQEHLCIFYCNYIIILLRPMNANHTTQHFPRILPTCKRWVYDQCSYKHPGNSLDLILYWKQTG